MPWLRGVPPFGVYRPPEEARSVVEALPASVRLRVQPILDRGGTGHRRAYTRQLLYRWLRRLGWTHGLAELRRQLRAQGVL